MALPVAAFAPLCAILTANGAPILHGRPTLTLRNRRAPSPIAISANRMSALESWSEASAQRHKPSPAEAAPQAAVTTGSTVEVMETESSAEDGDDDGVEEDLYTTEEDDRSWKPPARRVKLLPTKQAAVTLAIDSARNSSLEPGPSAPRARRAGLVRSKRAPPPKSRGNNGPLTEFWENLPVAQHRDQVLAALRERVSIIEGATGSGKTTQVSQYILEKAAAEGRRVRVACTQPRRISAIGVAERVAAERERSMLPAP